MRMDSHFECVLRELMHEVCGCKLRMCLAHGLETPDAVDTRPHATQQHAHIVNICCCPTITQNNQLLDRGIFLVIISTTELFNK